MTESFGKSFSVGNLKNIRQFYQVYSVDQIGQTVFTQFENLTAVANGRKFFLSWSHYLVLMRIHDMDDRPFYEIEAVKNDLSLSDMNRQLNNGWGETTMKKLGAIKKITDLRSVWSHEEYGFSKWLAEDDNLSLLGDAVGIDIVLEELESDVGGFRVDLFASEEGSGRRIIIENQLEDTNHDHLGKIITYASGKDASIIIWIVKRARNEHRQAIEWLNQHTDEGIGFFLVEIELWQIDNSAYAPKFNVVERPNDWAKEIKVISNATQQARLEYWTAFNSYAFANKSFAREFKQRKPSTDHWMSFSIGTSACGMSVLRLQQQSQIAVEFCINDDKELFHSLLEHKAEIEAAAETVLDWRELPEKKASRILVKRDAELQQERDWPGQFEWIMDKLVKMKKAFKKYL